jgi:GT2 family glycosyltransferase
MLTYVVIPQFLVTDELVTLAKEAIESYRASADVFIISVDDAGEYPKAKGADEAMALSDLVLTNKKNSGFGPTCNKGFKWIFKHVKDDCYIICSNNDILINKRVLPALTEPFQTVDNIAISGIFSTTEHTWEGKPLEEIDLGRMSEGGQLGDRMQDGGLWCSKKSILQKIGIFDEQFLRGGYEDVDIFLRARDTFGMKIVMSNRAVYWHKQGATRWNTEKIGAVNDFGRESKSIENENLQKFINKWGYNPHQNCPWKEKEIFNAL